MAKRLVGRERKLPVVEIFQSLQGEGTRAGLPTTFIRLFGCNLRCSWCDTKYSYEPEQPQAYWSIPELIERVAEYHNRQICLTGGEPLLHRAGSGELLKALARLDWTVDLQVETNGAVDLGPFASWREQDRRLNQKLRFIMDYKLPSSGATARMVVGNFHYLLEQDEIKFVIADETDFAMALAVLEKYYQKGQPLFAPVWQRLKPQRLAELIIKSGLPNGRLSLPLHKIIWGERSGV